MWEMTSLMSMSRGGGDDVAAVDVVEPPLLPPRGVIRRLSTSSRYLRIMLSTLVALVDSESTTKSCSRGRGGVIREDMPVAITPPAPMTDDADGVEWLSSAPKPPFMVVLTAVKGSNTPFGSALRYCLNV